ncbi:uncharacterized protein DI49_2045 [Saccharomyces eubayanus]|uniref:uncharacterized protein n=1 Tax=Saccharomyces eubayanus TaxID=1080349 RepID=UPI0006C6F14C|nr:hypothetical protein DI49_2045 [Saccharomyces eubayanus]KOG99580.1 hypothetical protein DI49_2045 [Saccharomyces eubayanus]
MTKLCVQTTTKSYTSLLLKKLGAISARPTPVQRVRLTMLFFFQPLVRTITILDWRCRMSEVERTIRNPSVGPFPASPLEKIGGLLSGGLSRGSLQISAGAARRNTEIADGPDFCPSSSLPHHLAVCTGAVAVTRILGVVLAAKWFGLRFT